MSRADVRRLQRRIDLLVEGRAAYGPFPVPEDVCGVRGRLPDGTLVPCPLHFAHPGPHGDDFFRFWPRSTEGGR